MRGIVAGLVLASFLFSGCIELMEDDHEQEARKVRGGAASAKPVPGTMTAERTEERSVRLCAVTGVSVPPPTRYCGTHTYWIAGETDLKALPVVLATFNGRVDVTPASGSGWNLTVTAVANNKDSDAQVRSTLDNHVFTFEHEKEGGHFLHAKARAKSSSCNNTCPTVNVALRLPASMLVSLDAATSNGQVQLGSFEYTSLVASTSNGQIDVAGARLRDAVLSTSNGQIDVQATAFDSGRWVFSTSNGQIDLSVPEDSSRGYSLTGDTSNGAVEISLKDGTVSGTKGHRSFKTTDYASRQLQTQVVLTTSNGQIEVTPAMGGPVSSAGGPLERL